MKVIAIQIPSLGQNEAKQKQKNLNRNIIMKDNTLKNFSD